MLSVDSSASCFAMGAVSLFSSSVVDDTAGTKTAADALDKAVPPDDGIVTAMFFFGRPLFLFAAGGTAANDAFSVAAPEAFTTARAGAFLDADTTRSVVGKDILIFLLDEFADAEGADRFLRTG